jgi:hypothetical protein
MGAIASLDSLSVGTTLELSTQRGERVMATGVDVTTVPGSGAIQLTANFTMPAALATAAASVSSTAALSVGAWVFLASAGPLAITAVGVGTVTLRNLALNDNPAAGTVIAAGSRVVVEGDRTDLEVYDVRRYGATAADVGIGVKNALLALIAAGGGGTVYIPPLPGGQHWGWITNVGVVPGLFRVLVALKGGPGTAIDITLANPGGYALLFQNLFYSTFHIHDLNFYGLGGATPACASVINSTATSTLLERCYFYQLLSDTADTGVITLGGTGHVTDCGWFSSGSRQARGGCLLIGGGTSVVVERCDFEDVDGTGGSVSDGTSWVFVEDTQTICFRNCFFDEDQNAAIRFDAQTTRPSVLIESCLFNTANSGATAPPNASVRVTGAKGVATLAMRDCQFQFAGNDRVAADLTNVDFFELRNINTDYFNGQASVTGDVRLVCRAGNGSWELRNVNTRQNIVLDFSQGAPKQLSLNTKLATTPVLLPSSLPCQTWLRPNMGPTFSSFATITGAGATYAAVTAGHHLDLEIDGSTYAIGFTGAENTQLAFFLVINSIVQFLVATNSGGQTTLTATPTENVSSGTVLNTSSADVLASLGLTAIPFTPAVIGTLADQSGAADATHNVTSGSGPTYSRSVAAFGGKPTMTFAAGQFLLSPAWTTPIAQPFTICWVGRQTLAATAYVSDGLAAGQAHINGVASEAALHLNAGVDANFPILTSGATIWVARFNGATTTLSVNGGVGVTLPAGAGGMTGLKLGNSQAGGQGGWELAEYVIVSGLMTEQQEEQYVTYASAEWGLPLTDAGETFDSQVANPGVGAGAGQMLPLTPHGWVEIAPGTGQWIPFWVPGG